MQPVSIAVPEEAGRPASPRALTFAEDEEEDMLSPLNSPARSYGNALAEEEGQLPPSTITPIRPLRQRSDSYGNATLLSSFADEADPTSPPNDARPNRLRADSYYSAMMDAATMMDAAEAEAAADLADLLVALDAAEAEADAPDLTLVAPAIDPGVKVAVGACGMQIELLQKLVP